MTKNPLPFIFALFTWTLLPSNTLGYLPSQQLPRRQSHTHLFVSSSTDKKNIPGTAKLDKDWEQLGFEFRQTKSNARIVYKNGAWGDIQLVEVKRKKNTWKKKVLFLFHKLRLIVLIVVLYPCRISKFHSPLERQHYIMVKLVLRV